MQLLDGTIVPSFLRVVDEPDKSGLKRSFEDVSLKIGEVKAAYDPDDVRNLSKKFIEYDVRVVFGESDGALASIFYYNAQIASLFGGVADYFRWTPRIENFDLNNQVGLGSRVLLLCINGNTRNAYIIGGIPHPDETSKAVKSNGHNLVLEFNGVNITVDNEGDFTLLHKGATNANGSIKDSSGTGGYASFTSDGAITLGYATQDRLPSIILDKGTKDIKIDIPHQLNVTADNAAKFKTSSFLINNGGIDFHPFLKSQTYRTSETTMHSTMQSALGAIAGACAAIAALTQTMSESFKIPVAGPIACVPQMKTVSAQFATLSAQFISLVSALSLFEGQSPTYLSQFHAFAEQPPLE